MEDSKQQNETETFLAEKAVLKALTREVEDEKYVICPERVVALSEALKALVAKEELISRKF